MKYQLRRKPITVAPISPRKTFFTKGCAKPRFTIRNASSDEPKYNINEIDALAPVNLTNIRIAANAIKQIEAHSPSIPSIRLIEFITPTTQKTVANQLNLPLVKLKFSPNKSPKLYISIFHVGTLNTLP